MIFLGCYIHKTKSLAFIKIGGLMLVTIFFPFVLVLDSFLTSITYGISHIKVPKQSILIISFINTFFLAFSLLCATSIKSLIPNFLCSFLSFLLFFLLGISNLLRYLMHKQTKKEKKFSFKWDQVHFVIAVYFDERKADIDHSCTLSSKEASLLAITLSFDSLLSGFSIGLSSISIPLLLLLSFFLTMISIQLGLWIGSKISNLKFDFSWISALLFFLFAFSKCFS